MFFGELVLLRCRNGSSKGTSVPLLPTTADCSHNICSQAILQDALQKNILKVHLWINSAVHCYFHIYANVAALNIHNKGSISV